MPNKNKKSKQKMKKRDRDSGRVNKNNTPSDDKQKDEDSTATSGSESIEAREGLNQGATAVYVPELDRQKQHQAPHRDQGTRGGNQDSDSESGIRQIRPVTSQLFPKKDSKVVEGQQKQLLSPQSDNQVQFGGIQQTISQITDGSIQNLILRKKQQVESKLLRLSYPSDRIVEIVKVLMPIYERNLKIAAILSQLEQLFGTYMVQKFEALIEQVHQYIIQITYFMDKANNQGIKDYALSMLEDQRVLNIFEENQKQQAQKQIKKEAKIRKRNRRRMIQKNRLKQIDYQSESSDQQAEKLSSQQRSDSVNSQYYSAQQSWEQNLPIKKSVQKKYDFGVKQKVNENTAKAVDSKRHPLQSQQQPEVKFRIYFNQQQIQRKLDSKASQIKTITKQGGQTQQRERFYLKTLLQIYQYNLRIAEVFKLRQIDIQRGVTQKLNFYGKLIQINGYKMIAFIERAQQLKIGEYAHQMIIDAQVRQFWQESQKEKQRKIKEGLLRSKIDRREMRQKRRQQYLKQLKEQGKLSEEQIEKYRAKKHQQVVQNNGDLQEGMHKQQSFNLNTHSYSKQSESTTESSDFEFNLQEEQQSQWSLPEYSEDQHPTFRRYYPNDIDGKGRESQKQEETENSEQTLSNSSSQYISAYQGQSSEQTVSQEESESQIPLIRRSKKAPKEASSQATRRPNPMKSVFSMFGPLKQGHQRKDIATNSRSSHLSSSLSSRTSPRGQHETTSRQTHQSSKISKSRPNSRRPK